MRDNYQEINDLMEQVSVLRTLLAEAEKRSSEFFDVAAAQVGRAERAENRLEEAYDLLKSFAYAYEAQDADGFTDQMREAYAAADVFITTG